VNVVALIPARNEAERVAATVRAVCSIPAVSRVIVIDDASTDATADEARRAGAEVIANPQRLGKGGALDAGLAAAADADALVLLDADLGESASEASRLLEPVLSGTADMSIATFPPPERPAGFGLVKGLARWGIRVLGRGIETTAPLSGQRALGPRAWRAVTPFALGYGVEVALTVRAARAGLTVVEIPTSMTHRATGRDAAGFAHRGRQFLHVARALLRLAFER